MNRNSSPVRADHGIVELPASTVDEEDFSGYVSGADRRKSPSLRKSPRSSPVSMGSRTRTPSPHLTRMSRTPSPHGYGSRRSRRKHSTGTGSAFERRQRKLTSPSHGCRKTKNKSPLGTVTKSRVATRESPSNGKGKTLGSRDRASSGGYKKKRSRSLQAEARSVEAAVAAAAAAILSQEAAARGVSSDGLSEAEAALAATFGKLEKNPQSGSSSTCSSVHSSSIDGERSASGIISSSSAFSASIESSSASSLLSSTSSPSSATLSLPLSSPTLTPSTSPRSQPTEKLSVGTSTDTDMLTDDTTDSSGAGVKVVNGASSSVSSSSTTTVQKNAVSAVVNDSKSSKGGASNGGGRYDEDEDKNYPEPATPRDLQFLNDSTILGRKARHTWAMPSPPMNKKPQAQVVTTASQCTPEDIRAPKAFLREVAIKSDATSIDGEDDDTVPSSKLTSDGSSNGNGTNRKDDKSDGAAVTAKRSWAEVAAGAAASKRTPRSNSSPGMPRSASIRALKGDVQTSSPGLPRSGLQTNSTVNGGAKNANVTASVKSGNSTMKDKKTTKPANTITHPGTFLNAAVSSVVRMVGTAVSAAATGGVVTTPPVSGEAGSGATDARLSPDELDQDELKELSDMANQDCDSKDKILKPSAKIMANVHERERERERDASRVNERLGMRNGNGIGLRDGAVPPPPPETDSVIGFKSKSNSFSEANVELLSRILQSDAAMSLDDIRTLEKLLMKKKQEMVALQNGNHSTDWQDNSLSVLESLVERQQQTLVDLGYIVPANDRAHKSVGTGDTDAEIQGIDRAIRQKYRNIPHDDKSFDEEDDEDDEDEDDVYDSRFLGDSSGIMSSSSKFRQHHFSSGNGSSGWGGMISSSSSSFSSSVSSTSSFSGPSSSSKINTGSIGSNNRGLKDKAAQNSDNVSGSDKQVRRRNHRTGTSKMFEFPVSSNSSSSGRGKSASYAAAVTASSSSSTTRNSKISSSHEGSDSKTRQHRRDFGKSPGGIMFRQSPHPLVPPLNLVALTKKNVKPGVPAYRVVGGTRGKPPTSKQPPLSRSGKKSKKHKGASSTVSFILHPGPRPITREITPHRHKLGIYSPRAQLGYETRNPNTSMSPALSKCVEAILSPRSAFSKASSISSGTNSAFSTPNSSPFPTPRSARSGITPRGTNFYLSQSPRTPRTYN